jgi:hypothetical protein
MGIQDKYNAIKGLVDEMGDDVEKVENSQTKAAGKRVRKGLQEVKKLSQELRLDIMDEIR